MQSALYTILALLAVSLLPDTLPAAGFGWDWLGGIGLCAVALLAAIGWDSESPTRSPNLQLHRNLAIGAALLTSVHAIGYLLSDEVVWEYLKPTAPAYMLVSLVAWLALVVMTISALPRLRGRLYSSFGSFKRWHLLLSISVLAGSCWHIIGTQYVISGWLRTTAFCLIVVVAPVCAYTWRHNTAARPSTPNARVANTTAATRHGALAVLLSVLLATVYAGIRNYG